MIKRINNFVFDSKSNPIQLDRSNRLFGSIYIEGITAANVECEGRAFVFRVVFDTRKGIFETLSCAERVMILNPVL